MTDQYGYKGFGAKLHTTGPTANPYQFGGQVGYFHDTDDRHYIRARNLSIASGRWISQVRRHFHAGGSGWGGDLIKAVLRSVPASADLTALNACWPYR